jgi:hypothetical protein
MDVAEIAEATQVNCGIVSTCAPLGVTPPCFQEHIPISMW